MADQAKNLCEETVFAATGQGKATKVYRILFLDRDNTLLAPMAEAIARQNFPNSGRYESAALTPATAVAPEMVEFLAARGIDAKAMTPHAFDKVPLELAEYHVVVSLQGPVSGYLKDIPFLSHTTTLEWDLVQSPDEAGLDYEALYRALSVQVRELMEQLRGPEAD